MPTADPALASARCKCGAQLWKKRRGEWTLANRTVALRDDAGLVAVCPECREDVPLSFLRLHTPNRRMVAKVDIKAET